MQNAKYLRVFLALLLAAAMASCGGALETPFTKNVLQQGSVFVVGTDAPLASVLAFRITFTGLTASDGTNSVPLLTQPQEIEFARLNGLRNLLALNSVPTGTYTSITANLSAPVISFLDTSTAPPSVQTLNGQLTQSSVTVRLRQPLVVTDGGLAGLHLDFRLHPSLEVDAAGELTGRVDPHLAIRAIPPDAPEAIIDELRGGVVSVNLAANSFVMQGPHGRNITVVTDSQTLFEPGEGLDTLTTDTIVEVSGSLQPVSLNLRATQVEVLSRDRFFLGGLITDVRPSPGVADQMDLLVRGELPDLANVQIGHITTLGFDGNEHFMIHHLRLPLQNLLFNRGSLVAGQRVAVGGGLTSGANPPTLDVRRVVLHRQGFEGGWVSGSTNVQNGNVGTFRFRAAGVAGILFGRPVRVFTSDRTRFVNLAGLGDLAGNAPIRLRVVGLVLLDHNTGEQVVIASAVEKLS